MPSCSREGWWFPQQGGQQHWPTCTEHIRARQTCWPGLWSLCGGLGWARTSLLSRLPVPSASFRGGWLMWYSSISCLKFFASTHPLFVLLYLLFLYIKKLIWFWFCIWSWFWVCYRFCFIWLVLGLVLISLLVCISLMPHIWDPDAMLIESNARSSFLCLCCALHMCENINSKLLIWFELWQ